jgi:S1-C subfamily serine protease
MSAVARLTLLLLLLLAAVVQGPAPVAGIDREIRDRVIPAAVQLSIDVTWVEGTFRDDAPIPIGSGTIISPDGLILTNAHVADPAGFGDVVASFERHVQRESPKVDLILLREQMVISVSDGVRPPQPTWRGEIVSRDERLDLALIRITERIDGGAARGPFPFVPIGDSDDVGLGDPIHIFGYPSIGDGALTYTTGVVSGFSFESRRDAEPSWINTDAVMSGGSSGGTAVNEAGELIGVPTQGAELDCRPGDTDRDGKITPDDVGCIPTGGSIGQLRPINLAGSLFAAAVAGIPGTSPDARTSQPSAQDQHDGPGATRLDAELAALAPTPAFLDANGFPRFVVAWSSSLSGSHATSIAALRGYPDRDGLLQVFGDSAFEQGFTVDLIPITPEDALQKVEVDLWLFDSPAAAQSAFPSIQPNETSTSADPGPVGGIGDFASARRHQYWSTTDAARISDLIVTMRVDQIVATLSLRASEHDPYSRSQGLALAAALAGEIRASGRILGPFPWLSNNALRFETEDMLWPEEAYHVRQGAAVPTDWDGGADGTRQRTEFAQEWEIRNMYRTLLPLPRNWRDAENKVVLESTVFDFSTGEDARSWFRAIGNPSPELGDFQELQGFGGFADESSAHAYWRDSWGDEAPEFHLVVSMIQGDKISELRLISTREADPALLESMLDPMETCLTQACPAMVMRVPNNVLALARAGGIARSKTPTPSPTPRPRATTVPTRTPRPTSTPTPGPAFGFTNPFDYENPDAIDQEPGFTSEYDDGVFRMTVTVQGEAKMFWADVPPGEDFAWRVRVRESAGAGGINLGIIARDGRAEAEWMFAVDPSTQQWSLYRVGQNGQTFFVWIEPRGYRAPAAGKPLELVVEMRDGTPVFKIDGVDIAGVAGIKLPRMSEASLVGFGVGIDPRSASNWSTFFSADFDEISLYPLP